MHKFLTQGAKAAKKNLDNFAGFASCGENSSGIDSRRCPASAFDIRLAVDLRVHHEVQYSNDVGAQLTAIDDRIDHAVIKKEFSLLKILRQLLTYRLFDN